MRIDFQDFESLCKTRAETNLTVIRLLIRWITNIVFLTIMQIYFQISFFILFLNRFIKTEKKMPQIFVHSLTKDQIYRNGLTDELFHFLAEERFPYSNDASDYLIYCKSLLLPKESSLKVTRSFSLYLIFNCFSRNRILNLSKTMAILTSWILSKKTVLKLSPGYLFYIFLEFCVWTEVKSKRKFQFITTQSSHKYLPIPFYLRRRNFDRHMIWYSANSIPIYKVGEIDSGMVFPQSLATNIDLHLVWDSFQTSFLEKQKIYNSKAFGSMLFYPKKIQNKSIKNSSIIYFDVVPANLFENTFYNTEIALSNLEGIVSAVNEFNNMFGKNLRLKVKHKRTPNKHHSVNYLNYVKKLVNSGSIDTILPTENLYRLINEAKFVIGTPYTSPVIIAKELEVNSAFVCFEATEYSIPDYFNEILVIKDTNKLLDRLIEFI